MYGLVTFLESVAKGLSGSSLMEKRFALAPGWGWSPGDEEAMAVGGWGCLLPCWQMGKERNWGPEGWLSYNPQDSPSSGSYFFQLGLSTEGSTVSQTVSPARDILLVSRVLENYPYYISTFVLLFFNCQVHVLLWKYNMMCLSRHVCNFFFSEKKAFW